ncbi:hypothetical protein L7F22_055235 [Adiantum nelumboides]|nr:hypothetical protein [Adiantum nelumboides]
MARKRKAGSNQRKAKEAKRQDIVSCPGGIDEVATNALPHCDIASTQVVLKQPAVINTGFPVQSSPLKPISGDGDDDIRHVSELKGSDVDENTQGIAYRRSSRIQEIEKKVKEVQTSSNVLTAISVTTKNEEVIVEMPADVKEGKMVVKKKVSRVRVSASQQKKLQELPSTYSSAQVDDPEASQKVKETLRLFNTYYLRAVQVRRKLLHFN